MNKSKTLALLGVVLLAVILWGASLNRVPETTDTTAYRQNFLDGCISEGANMSYCSCTYDGLVGLYGFQGLIDVSNKISEGNFTTQENAVIRRCAKQL